ncbi:MAG: hypothetical protein OEX07_16170 [Gammaproteobacteria bacterium]|nr:hypothetical protein [Gammaproteobacteria bacterium]
MLKKYIISNFLTIIFIASVVGCTETAPQQKTKVKASTYQTNISGKSGINGYILRNDSGERIATGNNTILAGHQDLQPSHVRGARIYDDFTIELAGIASPPAGRNPILDIATPTDPAMTPASDADTWRCSHCHGYDYEGGVYTFNNEATNNLLELKDVRGRDEEYVIHMLMDGFNVWNGTTAVNVHNYTGLLSFQAMVDVSDFVVNEIFDTHVYVQAPGSGSANPTTHPEGMEFYNSTPVGAIPPVIRVDGSNFNCVDCHGADGLLVPGIDLHTLAWTHPFKWLHRVNFGSPRSLQAFPDFTLDTSVHPGLYEVILTDGLHFGGPEQASALMAHVQMNLAGAP